MDNYWEHPSVIAAEALMHLEHALVIGAACYRDISAEFDKQGGYAVGETVHVKTRPEYEGKEFTTDIEIQGVRESKRPVTVEKHYDVSVKLTAKDLALNFDGFSEQVIQPASYALAEKIETYLGLKLLNSANRFHSATLLATAADMALARAAANSHAISQRGRFGLVNDTLEASLLGKDYFNTAATRGPDNVLTMREGAMGRMMGIDWLASLFMPTESYTAGDGAGSTNNGATDNQIGSSALVYDGGTGTFQVGDRIQIAGLKTQMIVDTQTTGAAGSIPLKDPITQVIPDNAAITVVGSGAQSDFQGIIADGNTFGVASPPLEPAPGALSAVASAYGYSLRVVRQYDVVKKTDTMSLDILVGAEAWDPRRSVMLCS